MFKNYNSAACVATMAMLSIASVSCQKDSLSNGKYSINTEMNLNDAWSIVYPRTKSDGGEPRPVYQYFVFNSNNHMVDHMGYYMTELQMSSNYPRTIDFITEAGTYNIVGITNLLQGEYPSNVTGNSVIKTDMITLTGVRDVCLGMTSLTVKASKLNYSTSIQAYHIMAQLGVSITGIPSDITELSVTLPNQSNQFDFNGMFFGSNQSIALNIVREDSPAADGTYTWSVVTQDSYGTYDWQLIYPSYNAAAEGETVPTTMPLTVVAKDSNNHSYTFNTSTTTRCTPGTRTLLTSSWDQLKYNDYSKMTLQPWQGEQQSGTFILE